MNTWDAPVNADFTAIDGYLGGVQAIVVGGAGITLTSPSGTATPGAGPTQAQNGVLRFTGAQSANIFISLPLPGYYIVDNQTSPTGNFVLRFQGTTPGGGDVISVARGDVRHIYNDGTNVKFVNLQPVGTYLDMATSTVPLWITSCTKPPYLICDGSTFSSVTYPALFNFLGTTTLPDFRGRGSFYLNGGSGRLTSGGAGIDGNTLFASADNNGVTLVAGQIPSIHSVNNAQNIVVTGPNGHTMIIDATLSSNNAAGGSNSYWIGGSSTGSAQFSGSNAISVDYTNGSQSVVPSASPGIVGGIRLIRAA